MTLGVMQDGGRLRPRRVGGRSVFVVVIVLFALLNVYRSTTLTQFPASSHEFSYHHHLLRHPPSSAADLRPSNRSTPDPVIGIW